jgi:antitoxin component YwqK of YwqJK toxin-antitoxin module
MIMDKCNNKGFIKTVNYKGEWVSYDANGNRTAVAVYAKGEKTGTWLFLE